MQKILLIGHLFQKQKKYPFDNLYTRGTLIDNPTNVEPIIVAIVSLSETMSKLFL